MTAQELIQAISEAGFSDTNKAREAFLSMGASNAQAAIFGKEAFGYFPDMKDASKLEKEIMSTFKDKGIKLGSIEVVDASDQDSVKISIAPRNGKGLVAKVTVK